MASDLRIGSGSNGQVYLSRDKLTGSPVAVKVARVLASADSPCNNSYFEKEAAILRRVSRARHVVQLREYLPNQIVMNPLYSGAGKTQNVYMQLKTKYTFSLAQIASCAHQLLEALSDLRETCIVHADIKPANIIFNQDSGIVRLCDFGNSDFIYNRDKLLIATTSLFAAPEVVMKNEKKVGYALDMWSLGVTLFHMYTRKYPFGSLENGYHHSKIAESICAQLGQPPLSFQKECNMLIPNVPSSGPVWETMISDESIHRKEDPSLFLDFLRRIFCYSDRLLVEEGLKHPFCQKDICIRMQCYMQRSEAKKQVLEVGGVKIPATEECIHLPEALDGQYQIKMGEKIYTIPLQSHSEITIAQDGQLYQMSLSKESRYSPDPGSENEEGEDACNMQ